MNINIEVGFFGLYNADTLFCKYVHEFLIDKLNSFKHGINIVGTLHVLESTFQVVDDRQYGDDGFLAAIEYEVGLLLDGAFAIVIELSYLT